MSLKTLIETSTTWIWQKFLSCATKRILFLLFIATEPPRIFHSDQKLTLLKRDERLEAKIGDQVTVLAGGNVLITCRTYGIPTPTVKWKKDGKDMSVSGDRLEIRNATTTDSGDFTCEAVNRAGRFSYTSKFQVIGEYQNKYYLVNKLAFLKGPNFLDISWHTNAKNVLELHSDGFRFVASVLRSYAPIDSRLWSFEDWIGKFPPPRTKMVFICPTQSSDFSVKCSS